MMSQIDCVPASISFFRCRRLISKVEIDTHAKETSNSDLLHLPSGWEAPWYGREGLNNFGRQL